MDNDDSLSLAEKFSNSYSDDDGIDSDLEGKLYAAVFHANDVSPESRDIAVDSGREFLTNVIDSAKNIPEKNSDNNIPNNNIADLLDTEDSDLNVIRIGGISDNQSYNDEIEISRNKNLLDVSKPLEPADELNEYEECLNIIELDEALTDEEHGIHILSRKEILAEVEIEQSKYMVKDYRENILNNDKTSPRTKIMTKHKNSPKLLQIEDSGNDNCAVESLPRNITHQDADNYAGSYLGDDLAEVPVSQAAAETSDIKVEEKLESNVPENRISSCGNETYKVDGSLNELSTIKPEEQLEKSQSINCEVVDEVPNEVPDVKPEEERVEIIQSMEKEVSANSRNSSTSNSSSEESSSSSSDDESGETKSGEKSDTILNSRNKSNDVIILDDSEDSIFEIPVPPKPSPPTIDLEDSNSSSSSDSDTSSETMSPVKLVQSYKSALSVSNSVKQTAGRSAESTMSNNTSQNPAYYFADPALSDSTTDSEEESWGIIAGNQINKNKPTENSSRDEINENLVMEVEQQDTSCRIVEDKNDSADLIQEHNESLVQDIAKRVYSDISSAGEEHSEILADNIGKEKCHTIDKILEDGNTLIINADTVPNLMTIAEIIEPETPTKSLESRKRSMTDSGKKTKQNSPKKAKSSEESVVAGTSSDKMLKENKENKDERRNVAADYFFKPMTNEMENYYNQSWGGENFDLDAIRRQMPRDPRHWAILNEDLLVNQKRRSRYWTDSKCRNCKRTGHATADCPEIKKVPCCHMCGAPGHREPRCPHKMCLGCGKKQKIYMQVCNGCRRAKCANCQSYGHVEDSCPDLWRRYHLTTSFENINTQLNIADVMKPQNLLSCCNCARRGHDSTTCNNYRWSRHFPTPAHVTNYNTGPVYAEDPSSGNMSVPSEATDRSETDNISIDISVPIRKKKRESNADRIRSVNLEPEEASETMSLTVDKNIDKSKEQSESDKDKAQTNNVVLTTNSESTANVETFLLLTSELFNEKITQAPNYRRSVIPLSAKECEALQDATSGREFLKNLTSQFPIKLEIQRSQKGKLGITISSTLELISPVKITITDWLKLPVEERSRFVSFNLPKAKTELLNLLSAKLKELELDLGDPIKLHKTVQSLKADLRNFQRTSKGGKKENSRRARVSEELARSQCKLNMILCGQMQVQRKFQRSCKFLRRSLKSLRKPNKSPLIADGNYLMIVHHYNIIFAAYTPNNIKELLDLYLKRASPKRLSRKKTQSSTNKNQDINTSTGSKVSNDTDNQILLRAINDRGGEASGTATYFNTDYSGVENQFVMPETNTKYNFDLELRPPRYPPPLMSCHAGPVANNYYNARYNFGASSNSRRRVNEIPNQRNDDFIALESYSSRNNNYNVPQDVDNLNSRSRARYTERNTMSNHRINKRIDNGFSNYPETNNQGDEWQCMQNVSQRDMFTMDTQGELLQNIFYNNESNLPARKDIDNRRRRFDPDDPTISNIADNTVSVTKQNEIGIGSKNKNKKKKEKTLHQNLRIRAENHIARHVDSECPPIVRAARRLRQKIANKSLTMNYIKKFEELVERERQMSILFS